MIGFDAGLPLVWIPTKRIICTLLFLDKKSLNVIMLERSIQKVAFGYPYFLQYFSQSISFLYEFIVHCLVPLSTLVELFIIGTGPD